jgi:predicted glycogen debranching enzyme
MPVMPLVQFGRETCADPEAALRREWIVTNGLGGYATAALDGTPVRRYSGWLVAALEPPVARTVVVGGLLEIATTAEGTFELGSLEREGGELRPAGGRHLESFELEGTRPVWTYALGATRLEKRAWMAYGANTTYVAYRVLDGEPVDLAVVPLMTFRDHHEVRPGDGRRPVARPIDGGLEVEWEGERTVTRLLGPGAGVVAQPDDNADGWVRGIVHRVETKQGLDDHSDLAVAGTFRVTLGPGRSWSLILTVEPDGPVERDGDRALAAARAREADLLDRAAAAGAPIHEPLVAQLILAADQFIVERPIPGDAEPGRSVIAGYPWFNDWGRDTMIALPGLALSTGRFDDAARILRSFAPWVRDGLLPNSFPDAERIEPAYHCVDAPLWYVHAVEACRRATGDETLVDELLPTLRAILDAYAAGTRFGIGMDPTDGLVRAGVPGVQLTWMDARAGDWVVTPRIGKPVEIQALWIHANRIAAAMCIRRGITAAYGARAAQAAAGFADRFWDPARGHLRDVVDGPHGDDGSLRPNQLFAVSLEPDLLAADRAAAVVDVVTRELWVGCGLRSLGPEESAYLGRYAGDRLERDAAYHQGTAWTWLIGPWAEASLRVGTPPATVRARLDAFLDHLREQGLGTIGEILDGDPPHRPAGCVAQAWGVAEVLRALRLVAQASSAGAGLRAPR